MIRNKTTSLIAYTAAHFCVDFSCAFLLYRFFSAGLSPLTSAMGLLLYSAIAFGFQSPLGAICDKYNSFPAGIFGCVLIILGLLFASAQWLALVFCALGNAFFHVEGGIDSLVNSNGRITRSGIFVSSGAVGLALGTILGKGSWASPALPLTAIALSIALILLFRSRPAGNRVCFYTAGPSISFSTTAVLAMLFVAVMIRSLGGFIIQMPWKPDFLLLPGIAACIGKVCGGMLADKFGAKTTGSLTLIASIPFLCFGWQSPLFCSVGIVLFNINMPITLCAVADRLPGHPGLSFGFTTLALLFGSFLPFMYTVPRQAALWVLPALCALSSILIYISISNKGGIKNEQNI